MSRYMCGRMDSELPAVYLLTIVVAYHCTVAKNIESEAVLDKERRIFRLHAIVLDTVCTYSHFAARLGE